MQVLTTVPHDDHATWPSARRVSFLQSRPTCAGCSKRQQLTHPPGYPFMYQSYFHSSLGLCCAVVRLACKTCGRIGCFSDCCIQERVLRITDPVLASLCCCIRCSHEMSPGHFCVAAGTRPVPTPETPPPLFALFCFSNHFTSQ